jgi:osmotically-inducible protein OsmY
MIRRTFFSSVIVALLSMLLFSACNQSNQNGAQTTLTDDQVQASVVEQYKNATELPAENVTVSVSNGIVTLDGEVPSLLAKMRATNLAQITKGVRSVINNTRVGAERPDDAIQRDVSVALYQDPATEPFEFGVDVNDGIASLTGTVSSWQERDIAEKVAKSVKGVRAVENRISLKPVTDRTDADIKNDIRVALAWDVRVSDGSINIAVNDGNVALTGSVGSAQVKKLVADMAHVQGVKEVDVSGLEVMPGTQDEMVRVEQPDFSDREIKKAIERAWKRNPRVSLYNLTANVEQGVVTISGSVDNLNSKISAARTVRNTVGVEAVNNNIETQQKVVVRPDLETTDSAIEERIVAAIKRDPYLETAKVKIAVDDGIVDLTGTVNTDFKREHFTKIASNTVGVLTVNNNIDVNEDANDID